MTWQLFCALTFVFVLGLFIGSSLGVILMCALRVSGWSSDAEMARGG